MPQIELEFASVDASKRVRHPERHTVNTEVYDPDPQSGRNSCGYDDSTPYPFGCDSDFGTHRRRQTATAELDSRTTPSILSSALLVGSVVLFVALVILAALRPWDMMNGEVLK